MLLQLLEVAELRLAIAACMTREQGGILLAPLCRAMADFVREADAEEEAGQDPDNDAADEQEEAEKDTATAKCPVWREAPPMWSLERVHARIERKYANTQHVGLQLVLKSLATELSALHNQYVIDFQFDRAAARNGKLPSTLGCHTMRVLEAQPMLWAAQAWSVRTRRQGYSTLCMREFAGPSGSHCVLNLLAELGVRARRGKYTRFPPDADVPRREALWHKEYVANSIWV